MIPSHKPPTVEYDHEAGWGYRFENGPFLPFSRMVIATAGRSGPDTFAPLCLTDAQMKALCASDHFLHYRWHYDAPLWSQHVAEAIVRRMERRRRVREFYTIGRAYGRRLLNLMFGHRPRE